MATCTTCPYCGVGCGVLASAEAGETVIKGDPDHPANFGRLCSKGSALGETLDLSGRLLTPKINGVAADWDRALDLVATTFRDAIKEHGPESVAFYGSGQLLTEDYYVANKLMKGFIGAANIDTNSRLCMASSVAGHTRAFGADTVPGTYEDLELADLIILVGSNLAWCHPVLYQRISAAKQARPHMLVVNIDPRRTATTDLADIHLAIAPGSDVALFNGLLAHLATQGATDPAFIGSHINGFEDALLAANAMGVSQVASETGITISELLHFYGLFAQNRKTVTVYSQGVNQSASGTDKVNAILNCHLATGRIGQPGMGPFSVTGQPNAMGGREVGGLANMLACHLAIENVDHRDAVQAFWQSPTICQSPGLKAVDLFNACADGKIKALWIMSTNPAVSLPDADGVREAIAAVPFVAVSDIVEDTDTCRLAHVLLPAAGWGEKSGTVTNSDRTISRQRPFLPKPGGAREDWQILADVARRMGWADAFAFEGPADVFREHAALSGVAAGMGRDFDISGLASISDAEYDHLKPTRWPVSATKTGERFFGDGRFFTPDGKARMVAVSPRPVPFAAEDRYPLRLNSGRIRDQWHTMTRSGKAARLSQHIAEPFLEIHPDDAAALDLKAAHLVVVSSAVGEAIARVLVTDRVMPGQVFMPIHWTSIYASNGRVSALCAPALDPVSGQPDLKDMPVRVAPLAATWHGFAVSKTDFAPDSTYWAKARTGSGWRAELAGSDEPQDVEVMARQLFNAADADAVSLVDQTRGTARVVLEENGQVIAALYLGTDQVEVSRAQAIAAMDAGGNAIELLAGRLAKAGIDPGRTVCSCFSVGANTIATLIKDRQMTTVADIGTALSAGTNCGSCIPDLSRLIDEHNPVVKPIIKERKIA